MVATLKRIALFVAAGLALLTLFGVKLVALALAVLIIAVVLLV